MATHIIIDGYNLMNASPRLSLEGEIALELGRDALLEVVAAYRRRKKHRITVVFDGWIDGSPSGTRQRRKGLEIVFSPKGVKADNVIEDLAVRYGDAAVVVTTDHALGDGVERRGGQVLTSEAFLERIADAGVVEMDGQLGGDEEAPEASMRHLTKKKGPARKAGKKERQRDARLKKL